MYSSYLDPELDLGCANGCDIWTCVADVRGESCASDLEPTVLVGAEIVERCYTIVTRADKERDTSQG